MRYEAETDGFYVSVWPRYSRVHSDENEGVYCFIYRIRIVNRSDFPATLVARNWIINDGRGNTQVVEGPGVVGEQPFLKPGDFFEYDSYCPLPTPTGNMRGQYIMEREDGETFNISVPIFFLRTDLDQIDAVIS